MPPAALINDGYTITATLKAQPPWPAITLKYRPALYEELFDYQGKPKQTGKAAIAAAGDLISKHVIGWDLVKEDGSPAPVTPEMVRLLPMPLVDRILSLIGGYTLDEQVADLKN